MYCIYWLLFSFGNVRVLNESYPMNTNVTGLRWFSKYHYVCVLWMKVASALEGLTTIKANYCLAKYWERW